MEAVVVAVVDGAWVVKSPVSVPSAQVQRMLTLDAWHGWYTRQPPLHSSHSAAVCELPGAGTALVQ